MVSFSKLATGILAVLAPAMAGAQAPGIQEARPTSTQPTTQPADQEEQHVQTDPGEFERKPEEKPPSPPPLEKPAPLAFKLGPDLWAYWKDGANLQSVDERFKFKMGGAVMGDFGWIDGSRLERDLGTDLNDRSEWRQLRLYVSGLIYDRLEFKLKADFAGSGTKLVDAYLRWRDLPYVGDVTVGHMKEPFGLERLTSSRYTTFLERSLPNVFAPPRSWGVTVSKPLFKERMTWTVGLFRTTDDDCSGFRDSGNPWSITGRVTYLPLYEEKGRKLLHVGAGYRDFTRVVLYLRHAHEGNWGQFDIDDIRITNVSGGS